MFFLPARVRRRERSWEGGRFWAKGSMIVLRGWEGGGMIFRREGKSQRTREKRVVWIKLSDCFGN